MYAAQTCQIDGYLPELRVLQIVEGFVTSRASRQYRCCKFSGTHKICSSWKALWPMGRQGSALIHLNMFKRFLDALARLKTLLYKWNLGQQSGL